MILKERDDTMNNDDVTREIIENWIAKGEWQNCIEAGGKAVEALITTLNDENLISRIEAARALGKIGDNKAVESLLVALTDHDCSTYFRDRNKNLCLAAAEALGLIGDPIAVSALIKELKNTHDNMRVVRQACADALAKIGLPAVEALVCAMDILPEDEFQREVQGDIARTLIGINEPVSSQAACEVLRKLEIVARCKGSATRPEHSVKVEKPIKSIEPAVAELCRILKVEKENNYPRPASIQRAKEIGQNLYRAGGFKLMQKAMQDIIERMPFDYQRLDYWWDGIGSWKY